MVPRECDNDDCDYETCVSDDGQVRVQWVHAEGCEGPARFPPIDTQNVREGSFLEFLLSGPQDNTPT